MLILYPRLGRPIALPPDGTRYVVRSQTIILSSISHQGQMTSSSVDLEAVVGKKTRAELRDQGPGCQASRFESGLHHLEAV